MTDDNEIRFIRLGNGKKTRGRRQLVEEYRLRLRVNGSELSTLVCSPHQLNFLLAGFCYQQGFINSLEDIFSLGICRDSGIAELILRNRPQTLPISACSCGYTYQSEIDSFDLARVPTGSYFNADLHNLLRQLTNYSKQYLKHGGIHSAAVGDEHGLLLYAEDIGRHNCFDRIVGEALFKRIDLVGKMLVTSGRISGGMAEKAARCGIGLLASRTSPTARAAQVCVAAGITLVGYLHGNSCEIYCHEQQLKISEQTEQPIAGVTGVILAGGESLRMGSDKSLLPIQGARFIDHVYRRMATLFSEVLIVTNASSLYNEIPCRKVPDLYPLPGALTGIHSGLVHAGQERIFVVACDMPFISASVVRYICSRGGRGDLIVPYGSNGHEPLHSLYSKNCLSAIEKILDEGRQRIAFLFDQVRIVEISAEEIRRLDPQEKSFSNINTPEDYFCLRRIFCGNPPQSTGTAAGLTVAGKSGKSGKF